MGVSSKMTQISGVLTLSIDHNNLICYARNRSSGFQTRFDKKPTCTVTEELES